MPASLPAVPANLNQEAKPLADADLANYGDVAADNGYLLGQYGSLAIRYNNLLLFSRCVIATANKTKLPECAK